jgi:hypothetical protein
VSDGLKVGDAMDTSSLSLLVRVSVLATETSYKVGSEDAPNICDGASGDGLGRGLEKFVDGRPDELFACVGLAVNGLPK